MGSGWRPTITNELLERLTTALRKECETHPEGAVLEEIIPALGCGYATAFYGMNALVEQGEVTKERGKRPDLRCGRQLYRLVG